MKNVPSLPGFHGLRCIICCHFNWYFVFTINIEWFLWLLLRFFPLSLVFRVWLVCLGIPSSGLYYFGFTHLSESVGLYLLPNLGNFSYHFFKCLFLGLYSFSLTGTLSNMLNICFYCESSHSCSFVFQSLQSILFRLSSTDLPQFLSYLLVFLLY